MVSNPKLNKSIHADLSQRGCKKLIRADSGRREHLSLNLEKVQNKSIRADLGRRGCKKLIRADSGRREHLSLNEPTSIGEGTK